MLSEVAIDSPETFKDLVTISKDALAGKAYTPKASKSEVKETKEAKKEEPVVADTKAEKKTTTKKATTTKSTTTKKASTTKTATKTTTKKTKTEEK